MSNRITDEKARELAIDPTRSWIVQAPAGSGKTELLIQRYLAVLATVDSPEQVVAVTFTRKAAAEMRERVLGALRSAGTGIPPESPHVRKTYDLASAVNARGWNLADYPSRMQVQTIDSLCSYIARRMPFLSGMGGTIAVADEAGVQAMYDDAARATLEMVEQEGGWTEVVGALLLHLNNDLTKAQTMLARMLGRRDQWLRHVTGLGAGLSASLDDISEWLRSADALREPLESAFGEYTSSELARIALIVPADLRQQLVPLARYAASQLGENDPLFVCRDLEQFPAPRAGELNSWCALTRLLLTNEGTWRSPRGINVKCGFPPKTPEKENLCGLLARHADDEGLRDALARVRTLPAPEYTDDQWAVLKSLLALLPVAAAQLSLQFTARGEVDFVEISRAAIDALTGESGPSDLAFALDCRIRHILVDEFQDTSLTQFTLLERLTSEWEPGDGRTLFLVGDPMQSIYAFREADVGLFLRARHSGIGTVKPGPLTLTRNFRSRPAIVDSVNAAFAQILPQKDDIQTGAISYTPCEVTKGSSPAEKVVVHPFIDATPADEARTVVKIVQEARAEFDDPTIAILVRSRTHLAKILPALRDANLPYMAVEIDQLASRPLVQDLASLTRALLHPADRIAWLAILRAPWCGLTLHDLHALAGSEEDQKAAVWTLVCDPDHARRLSPDGQARLAKLQSVVADCLARPRHSGLRAWIEGAWLALGGPAYARSTADLEDANAYFELLDELEEGGDLPGVVGLESMLSKLFAASDSTPEASRLQVMTIHKAKGLQFDVVILPGLGRQPRHSDPELLKWLETEREGGESRLLLAPIYSTKGETMYEHVASVEKQRTDAEVRRLLYVAATRAIEQLHLLGCVKTRIPKDSDSRELKPAHRESFLAKMWEVVEPEFVALFEQMPEPVPQEESSTRTIPVLNRGLERFRTGWTPPAPPPPPAAPKWLELELEKPSEQGLVLPRRGFSASERLRCVGVVVHRTLQVITEDGIEKWDATRIRGLRGQYESALLLEGLPASLSAEAAQDVETTLLNALASDKGRWILRNDRTFSKCEYPLGGVVGAEMVSCVVDRTFVDDDGTCWVIDYKTAPYEGEDRERWLEHEMEKYRRQLERYTELMAALQPDRQIRAGLFFPLSAEWRELT